MSEVKERKTAHMKISGMSCSSCVSKIERHMAKQRGNGPMSTHPISTTPLFEYHRSAVCGSGTPLREGRDCVQS